MSRSRPFLGLDKSTELHPIFDTMLRTLAPRFHLMALAP
jgi:hypothetical protein